jgi:hypothetical protein
VYISSGESPAKGARRRAIAPTSLPCSTTSAAASVGRLSNIEKTPVAVAMPRRACEPSSVTAWRTDAQRTRLAYVAEFTWLSVCDVSAGSDSMTSTTSSSRKLGSDVIRMSACAAWGKGRAP